jgi:hypothetical protein
MNVADAKGRRWDAATGIGFAVLAVIALALPGTPPKADDSILKIGTYFADKDSKILAGNLILAVAGVLFVWFLGSVRSYLRAGEGGEGRLSAASFGGGLIGIAMILAGAALFNGIAFKLTDTHGVGPDLVRAVFDAASAVLAMAGVGFAVFIGAASCSGARSGALPPWAYWSGSVIALLQLLGLLALVAKSGFFATGGALSLIGPLLALIWIVAVSVVIMRRDGVPPVPRAEP